MKMLIKPTIAMFIAMFLVNICNFNFANLQLEVTVKIIIYSVIFIAFMFISKGLQKEDIKI